MKEKTREVKLVLTFTQAGLCGAGLVESVTVGDGWGVAEEGKQARSSRCNFHITRAQETAHHAFHFFARASRARVRGFCRARKERNHHMMRGRPTRGYAERALIFRSGRDGREKSN